MEQLTYADAVQEYRLLGDSGDPWGTMMQWWFTVAEEMHSRGLPIPASWQYRQGLSPQNDPTDPVTEVVVALSDADLAKLGNVLDRYASILKKAGKDY